MSPSGFSTQHPPEALYLRGLFHSAGWVPSIIPLSARDAFSDWEGAALGGCGKAWFRLGRDYETVNDIGRARDCFERGAGVGAEACIYVRIPLLFYPPFLTCVQRIGIAHLLGQLSFIPLPQLALPLLKRAADLSNIESPHPAYVYGLLLRNEFSQAQVDDTILQDCVGGEASLVEESRKYIEKAAWLGFGPALMKVGMAHEFAESGWGFDAIKSVWYYT